MELYIEKPQKAGHACRKINWTEDMITAVIERFPVSYNKELAAELHISWRSLVRKARELGIDKEPGFLDNRRDDISRRALEAHPPNMYKGRKGWCVPGSDRYWFQKGRESVMKTDPEVRQRAHAKRNNTIRRERIRIHLGLTRLTKLNLK